MCDVQKNEIHLALPSEQAKRARALWLDTHPDLEKIESMYRSVIGSFMCEPDLQEEGNSRNNQKSAGSKRKHGEEGEGGGKLEDWQRLAVEQFCMILCQSGRAKNATPYLQRLGYTCRLASCVLNYPSPSEAPTDDNNSSEKTGNIKDSSALSCRIWDNFLSPMELQHLRNVFEDPQGDYWVSHRYQVEPPSPYFSYIIPLYRQNIGTAITVDKKFGCLGTIITKLHQQLIGHFPRLSGASAVELWAHNRPPPTGHQFHFDSDNEGEGKMVKNPIVTAILYLSRIPRSSKDGVGGECGGPSVITNQVLVSQHLATKAVMSLSTSPGRVVAFDGSLLHGVIPGKGTHSGSRRVTLMLAFWKRIRVRPGDKPGAARPFPFQSTVAISSSASTSPLVSTTIPWNVLLVRPLKNQDKASTKAKKNDTAVIIERKPFPLDRLYETLDGKKWTKTMGFPEYDQVFQGF